MSLRPSKVDGDPELRRIDKVARKFYLYVKNGPDGKKDYRLEEQFSRLENFFDPKIWRRISTEFVDLNNDAIRKLLSLIMATMFLRNPLRLTDSHFVHRDIVKAFSDFSNNFSSIADVEVRGKIAPFDYSDWDDFKNADDQAIKEMWIDQIKSNAVWLSEIIMEMRWAVIFSETPVFITSDNPVVLLHETKERYGFGTEGAFAVFPLSPTMVLHIDNSSEPDGHYYPVNDAASVNFIIWQNSISEMFSPRHPDEVCSEFLESSEKWEQKFSR